MQKFTDNDFELDVRADIESNTVWLTQSEMALLFAVDRTRITRHINNIYNDHELERNSISAESAHVQIENHVCKKCISTLKQKCNVRKTHFTYSCNECTICAKNAHILDSTCSFLEQVQINGNELTV